MEFDFDVGRVLVPFALEGDASEGTPQVARLDDSALNHGGKGAALRELLDVLGEGSRRAQGLSKPVTTGRPLMSNRIYLLYMGRYALGLLKVGTKRLFVSRGEKEGLVDISPTCVLDFYVVEGHQRGGLGRRLFDVMLRCEHTSPERLAYDRPSPKLIGFLRRHYGLAPYQPQANHFVVFDAYWAKAGVDPARSRSSAPGQRAREFAAKLPPAPVPYVAGRQEDPRVQVIPPWASAPSLRQSRTGSRGPCQRAGQSTLSSPMSLVAAMAQGNL